MRNSPSPAARKSTRYLVTIPIVLIAAALVAMKNPSARAHQTTPDMAGAAPMAEQAKLNALESSVTSLTETVATQQQAIASLSSELKTRQNMGAAGPFQVSGNDVYLTGYNLHIESGSGKTDGQPNGLGNLIIGYNETTGASAVQAGSHNLILGDHNSYSSYAEIVAGSYDMAAGPYCSVLGGQHNTAAVDHSTILGGRNNTSVGGSSCISGGYQNLSSGAYASVTGGVLNTASGTTSCVNGGLGNNAASTHSTVPTDKTRDNHNSGSWTDVSFADRFSRPPLLQPISNVGIGKSDK